jgi:hypothetical protein
MADARPRTVVVSEIIQILLLAEPIWRAVQERSVVSLIGTLVFSAAVAALIVAATRQKKIWARDLLAGVAVISIVVWVLTVGSAWGDTLNQHSWGRISSILFVNLIAVALLFTDGADQWFLTGSVQQTGRVRGA